MSDKIDKSTFFRVQACLICIKERKHRMEWELTFGDANEISKTIDSIRDTRLTATCCDGHRRSSERRARGARTERGRAATETAERGSTRERSAAARAGSALPSEHEFVVASRGACCLLLLVGAQSCAPPSHCPRERCAFRAIVDQSAI